VYAIISAVCFALHNYLVYYAMKTSNIVAVTCEGFPFTLTYAVYLVHNYFVKKRRVKKNATTDDKVAKDESVKCWSMVFLRGVLTCKLAINTALISYYSVEGGVSPSVMLSIVALTSFTTAISFYYLYNERLLFKQMIGMGIIMLSVIVISVSRSFRLHNGGTSHTI